MIRILIACALLLVVSGGCALCTSCEDDTYSAYGGRWERDDPAFGRVGSAFEPAGYLITDEDLLAEPGAEYELLEETPPPEPDELDAAY